MGHAGPVGGVVPPQRQGEVWDAFYFGPFAFRLEDMQLFRGGHPVAIAPRLAAVLRLLLENAGLVVTQERLHAAADPAGSRSPSSLRVYVSALNRLLGDRGDGSLYLRNEHGRGYRFVAGVTRSPPAAANSVPHFIGPVTKLVGRGGALMLLRESMEMKPLVSIVGPGGIGKSALALSFASQHHERYSGGIHFLDLALLDDPLSLAAHVGGQLTTSMAVPYDPRSIGIALRGQDVLLIFDNCEHVLGAVGAFIEEMMSAAPTLHILATTREALGVEGEQIFYLAPLEIPRPRVTVSSSEARDYSAVALFLERAMSGSTHFRLTDENTQAVVELCRRLDGMPLAIELAAAWVEFFGVEELRRSLDSHFLIVAPGSRTALPRHRTLAAMIEWSYRSLSVEQRTVLNRLSVFRASFNMISAIAVAGDEGMDASVTSSAVASLAAKSLISVDLSYPTPRYRLLETTRQYVFEKLAASEDYRGVQRRHALRCLELLRGADQILLRVGREMWVELYRVLVADTLVALNWAFSKEGDAGIGIEFTDASTVFGDQFLLHREYDVHIRNALHRIAQRAPQGGETEIELRLTLARLLELRGDPETAYTQMGGIPSGSSVTQRLTPKSLTIRWSASWVTARYREALQIAAALGEVADRLGDPEVKMVANRIMSQSAHFLGDNAEAKRLATMVLNSPFEYLPFTNVGHKISMRIVLARIAFMEGSLQEAKDRIEEVLAMGERDNSVALCQVMGIGSIPIAIWSNDLESAARMTRRLDDLAHANDMGFWKAFSEQLQIAIGLRTGALKVRPARTMGFSGEPAIHMITDLAATLEPRMLTSRTIERVDQGEVGWCAPEVMRVDALSMGSPAERRARLNQGLDLAKRQGMQFWADRLQQDLKLLMSVQQDSPGEPTRRRPQHA